MPQKRTTAAKRTAAKKSTAKKAAAPRTAAAAGSAPAKGAPAPQPAASASATGTTPVTTSSGPREMCPRCGSTVFGPEPRIRAEGNRTVRYTILVCERGHTFAKPARRTD